jgi:hypothetical protein
VGYLKEAFDDTKDPLKKNDEQAIAQMEEVGIKLIPVKGLSGRLRIPPQDTEPRRAARTGQDE